MCVSFIIKECISYNKMILLMQFYKAHNVRRQRELNECVANNATRPFIDKLVLFIQGDNAMEEYRSIDFNKDNVISKFE